LERQEDDWISLEVGAVRLARVPNGEIGEQRREVVRVLLEEAAKHGHGERLAETSRARQEQGLRALVEDLPDELRLVDVLHAPLPKLAEIVDADGDGTQHGCKEA